MICLCAGLSQSIVSSQKLKLADSMQYPQGPKASQADNEFSEKKKKKIQLKWTKLEFELFIWRQVDWISKGEGAHMVYE